MIHLNNTDVSQFYIKNSQICTKIRIHVLIFSTEWRFYPTAQMIFMCFGETMYIQFIQGGYSVGRRMSQFGCDELLILSSFAAGSLMGFLEGVLFSLDHRLLSWKKSRNFSLKASPRKP